jgi:hypothetical protein
MRASAFHPSEPLSSPLPLSFLLPLHLFAPSQVLTTLGHILEPVQDIMEPFSEW